MSTVYRFSRNLEASCIEYIEDQLEIGEWSGISVIKGFKRVYDDDVNVPVICVRLQNTIHQHSEIGSNSTFRFPLILLDIFGSSDGNRLDLKDFLVSILKNGFIYYEYVIIDGEIDSAIANGRINVDKFTDIPVDFDVPKNQLHIKDRYRHLLSLSCSRNRIET